MRCTCRPTTSRTQELKLELSERQSIRSSTPTRLGWDYVWLTEHHFLRQFSHMSAAEVLFGAAAYATEHIRFGFGLALTPPKYNHPVRIAERVAMLDCLSNGRVDLGSGTIDHTGRAFGL